MAEPINLDDLLSKNEPVVETPEETSETPEETSSADDSVEDQGADDSSEDNESQNVETSVENTEIGRAITTATKAHRIVPTSIAAKPKLLSTTFAFSSTVTDQSELVINPKPS